MNGSAFQLARSRPRLAIVAAAACLAATPSVSWSQTWTAGSPGNFLTPSNWGGSVPNAIDASASIAMQPTGPGNFTLNGLMTLGALNYSNSQSRSLNGSGTLTLQKSSGNPEFNIESGSLLVDVSVAIPTTTRFLVDTSATIDGIISGNGIIVKTGTGTLTLGANNTYTGGTQILNGTIRLTNNNRIRDIGRVSITSPGTLDLNNFSDTIASLDGDGSVSLGSGTLTTGGDNSSTAFTGTISGTGALTKTGSGTMAIYGSNTYTGTTTVSQGTLKLGGASERISNNSPLVMVAGATFDLNSFDETVASLSGDGSILLGSGSLTVGGNNTSTSFDGLISGTGGLTKTGSGTMSLINVNNSYSGLNTISGGVLSAYEIANAGVNSPFGQGNFALVNDGGLLYYGGNASTNRTFTLGSGGGTIGVSNPATGLTLNGVISGTGPFSKGGAGALQLGTSNTYTGNTLVGNGTLYLAASERIPDNSALTINSPAVLDLFDFNETVGSLSGDGNLVLRSGTLTVGGNNTSTSFDGLISGTGGLTKTGSGTMSLINVNNSYSGLNTISGGVLSAYEIANAGVNSPFGQGNFALVNDGGLLYYGGNASTNRTFTLGSGGGTIGVSNPATGLTLNGVISGTGPFSKGGAGALQLGAHNTYSGSTLVGNGTLLINVHQSIPNGSAVTVNSEATLDLYGYNDTIGSLAGSGNVVLGSAQLGGSILTVGEDNSSTTFDGTISGTGELTKTGSGTMTLSGSNSYSGLTTVTGGTLRGSTIANSGVNSAFGRGSFSISDNATLDYTGPSASTNRTVTLGSGGGTINLASGVTTVMWNGAISGSGSLTKSGPGTLQLSGANSYSGSTSILSGGTLKLGANNRIPDSSRVTVNSGAQLELGNFSDTIGSLEGGGNVVNNAGFTTGADNTSTMYDGSINGTGGLTKTGSGTMTLNGSNTYTGTTTVGQGTLTLGANERISNSSALVMVAGATLDINNFTETVASLSGDGSILLGSGILTVGGNNSSTSFDGLISGTGGLTKTGSGTMSLINVNNSYTGLNTISGGGNLSAYEIANAGVNSPFGQGNFAISNNSNLLLYMSGNASTNRTITLGAGGGGVNVRESTAKLTLNGVISGTGPFSKGGAGALLLAANNTYSGGTLVGNGTLIVNGSISGPVAIEPEATLGGSGTIHGNVSGGGRVAPGNSPGILHIDGDYTQNAGGTLEIEVGGLTPGTEHDQLIVTGTATLAGRLEVPIVNNFHPQVDDEITFLTAGILTGNFQTLVSPNLGSIDPNIAMIEIASMANGNARIRFVAATDDVTFVTILDEADWAAASTWSVSTGPSNTDIIAIENLAGEPQLVSVTTDIAPVHHLEIMDDDDPITVRVQGDKSLTATTDVVIASNAAVELGQPLTSDTGHLNAGVVSVQDGGRLSGNGSVSAELIVENGIVSPGFSVGHLDINGSYQQGVDGTLQVDVDGTQVGEWDTVDVSGAVQLDGTLRIDASNLSNVDPGTTIEIISAGSLSGAFDNIETTGSDDIYFRAVYDYVEGGMSAEAINRGDMNGDFTINNADFDLFVFGLMNTSTTKFLARCSQSGGPCDVLPQEGGDFNGNGRTDFDDIPLFQQSLAGMGMSDAGLAAAFDRYFSNVPEPSSAMLAVLGGLGVGLVGGGRRRYNECRLQSAFDGCRLGVEA